MKDLEHRYGFFFPNGATGRIYLTRDPYSPDRGRTIDEIAREHGEAPCETAVRLLIRKPAGGRLQRRRIQIEGASGQAVRRPVPPVPGRPLHRRQRFHPVGRPVAPAHQRRVRPDHFADAKARRSDGNRHPQADRKTGGNLPFEGSRRASARQKGGRVPDGLRPRGGRSRRGLSPAENRRAL